VSDGVSGDSFAEYSGDSSSIEQSGDAITTSAGEDHRRGHKKSKSIGHTPPRSNSMSVTTVTTNASAANRDRSITTTATAASATISGEGQEGSRERSGGVGGVREAVTKKPHRRKSSKKQLPPPPPTTKFARAQPAKNFDDSNPSVAATEALTMTPASVSTVVNSTTGVNTQPPSSEAASFRRKSHRTAYLAELQRHQVANDVTADINNVDPDPASPDISGHQTNTHGDCEGKTADGHGGALRKVHSQVLQLTPSAQQQPHRVT